MTMPKRERDRGRAGEVTATRDAATYEDALKLSKAWQLQRNSTGSCMERVTYHHSVDMTIHHASCYQSLGQFAEKPAFIEGSARARIEANRSIPANQSHRVVSLTRACQRVEG